MRKTLLLVYGLLTFFLALLLIVQPTWIHLDQHHPILFLHRALGFAMLAIGLLALMMLWQRTPRSLAPGLWIIGVYNIGMVVALLQYQLAGQREFVSVPLDWTLVIYGIFAVLFIIVAVRNFYD